MLLRVIVALLLTVHAVGAVIWALHGTERFLTPWLRTLHDHRGADQSVRPRRASAPRRKSVVVPVYLTGIRGWLRLGCHEVAAEELQRPLPRVPGCARVVDLGSVDVKERVVGARIRF